MYVLHIFLFLFLFLNRNVFHDVSQLEKEMNTQLKSVPHLYESPRCSATLLATEKSAFLLLNALYA